MVQHHSTSHHIRQWPFGIFSPIMRSVAVLTVRTCPCRSWMALSMNPLDWDDATGECSTTVSPLDRSMVVSALLITLTAAIRPCMSSQRFSLTSSVKSFMAGSWSDLMTMRP